MDPRSRSRCVVVSCFILILITSSVMSAPPEARGAYLDPALGRAAGTISVIVTAKCSDIAAGAVKRAGGTVTSDLWIANAVAARVDALHLGALTNDPTVEAVIENKSVSPASENWNGWVSDLRITKGKYTSGTNYFLPPTHLPGGGFAVMTTGETSGEIIVVNADGSERFRRTLTVGAPFYTSVMINGDATRFFVAGVYGAMYAFDENGNEVWRNTQNLNTNNYYFAPGVVASTGHLVMVTYYGTIFAFDPVDGRIVWQYSIVANKAEYQTAAVIGSDNTMYVSSSQGHIFAVSSTGVRWSVSVSSGGGGKNGDGGTATGNTPLLVGSTLYAASGSKLLGIDTTSGQTKFTFSANSTILGSPIAAPDGTVFIATNTMLYAVTPSGQTKWSATSPAGGFERVPVFSTDRAAVYMQAVPLKGKKSGTLVAYETLTGRQLFASAAPTTFAAQLVADPDGGVLMGTDDTSVYRYSGSGVETHRVKLHAPITHLSRASETGNILVQLQTSPIELHFIGRLPNAWNGRKDVEPARAGWRLVYNYSVDVGADKVHRKTTSSGQLIRGKGINVAVVDSGVYWDASTKNTLGVSLQQLFIGQADFIDTACGGVMGCTQRLDHAFYDYHNSRDPYGHGTHVAGSININLPDDAVSDQTLSINRTIGVAPEASILSVRVLGSDGTGTYERVIRGIQYVVENKAAYNIRVMNLSISAFSTVPYFVDPLNRAVERAWQSGIVVVAAAGNTGPFAGTITVPGNDPYVITVGAISASRTAGFWKDDILAAWSASGPTHDGFAKPDVLAPGSQIVSYMYSDPTGVNTPYLVRIHPDYSGSTTLFRMNGTSMATAVASGVVALMLQNHPSLTPDQVKYRLLTTAKAAQDKSSDEGVYNTLQQGLGRIWAPDAVLNPLTNDRANVGLDLSRDLASGFSSLEELQAHYQGPVQRTLSDDGTAYLYYATLEDGTTYALGMTDLNGMWLSSEAAMRLIWSGTNPTFASMRLIWSGGRSFTGDADSFSAMRLIWSGDYDGPFGSMRLIWSGTRNAFPASAMQWAGGNTWAGGSAWGTMRLIWSGSFDAYTASKNAWSQSLSGGSPTACNSFWVDDVWYAPLRPIVPPPAGVQ